ncbi:nicotinate (nicotinamide) nucleotide adenylyltransferase [Moheibacter lacus]|uniref:Probable nicotinate-nucleotide adenylyltransferase n=1 Tax=Moheibacter lacus TaxID=2745851 RepID=A0A838ZRQ1_9FLAO|nr:nicotinate (nicotinamide) nucleotide adenylyltransferase [Moheibacter lacus]MBA5629183.1 nicotinate-nucleotide adenylyltransferase [Moheibacter lacus]
MKIGLYFGSFNPIHIGHLVIANHLQQFSDLDQVWFVVSPQNPFKEKASLANDYDRLHLVNLAIENYPHLMASNIEFNLPIPSYTIDTLVVLKEKHPEHDFSLIMGMDNLKSFHKWKNHEQILKNYSVYVYPRIGSEPGQWENHEKFHFIDAPIMEISSTFIRQALKEKKNIQPMLPDEVWEYLDGSSMYK